MATQTDVNRPQEVSGSKGYECWFEYTPGYKATLREGLRVITDPDDLRWDNELEAAPFNGAAEGYVGVYHVLRFDGEVVKKKCLKGFSCNHRRAREFMQQVAELIKTGERRPWDTETFHRDQKEAEVKRMNDRMESDRGGFKEALEALLGRTSGEVAR